MVNVPTTLCQCDPVKSSDPILYEIPAIETCNTICEVPNKVELIPIVSTLCPCPEPKTTVSLIPVTKRTVILKTCFVEFIKNITSTKFCNKGPTCVPVI